MSLCYTASVKPLYPDTHPKIEQMQIELIRRMPSWRKFKLIDDLNETLRGFALTGIKERNPYATHEQVKRLLADLILGKELAEKVYGHVG